jgi:hypothetical protein
MLNLPLGFKRLNITCLGVTAMQGHKQKLGFHTWGRKCGVHPEKLCPHLK